MNFRLTTTILSGACVALMVILLTRGCDKPTEKPQDETLWRVKVQQREAVISEKDSIIAKISKKLMTDSLENVRVTTGLQMRNKALSEKLKVVEAKVPESAEFDRYVELVDSTIQVKDSLYAQAVNHSIALDSLYRIEVAALADKNVLQQEVSEEYRNRVEALERKSARLEKRFERKRKFNHVLLGIVGGLAASTTVLILTE